MSTPCTISLFNGDLSIREGKVETGLTFAYSPSSFRIASRPCSGRTFAEGSLSYLGSPMAPKRTASEDLQRSRVSSGRGFPVLSIAMAPTNPCLKLNL